MHPFFRSLALLSLLTDCACSTVVEGPTQKITVNSTPQGAHCLFRQADEIVGSVTTPGTAEVPKSKNDLVILCNKEGYESVSVRNRSDMAITSLGNMAFYQLSFVGDAVDSATGASNKYDSSVSVKLIPAETPVAFPVPPGLSPTVKLPAQSLAGLSMQVPMPATAAVPLPAVKVAAQAPAAPVAMPAAKLSPNPSLNAASTLADAARKVIAREQLPQLSYAQATAEAPRRPPFDVVQ